MICLYQTTTTDRLEEQKKYDLFDEDAYTLSFDKGAVTCDFQQSGIFTGVDSDKPVQTPFKLTDSKCCLVSSLTVIEYSSD